MMVFLLEEPSMARFLRGFLPRFISEWKEDQDFILIHHAGKQDLEKSLPRKLRGWNTEASFIVLRDNDGADCRTIKSRLLNICKSSGRSNYLVRLVMQELESWYLGDLTAVAQAYNQPKLAEKAGKEKFRDPDALGNPSQEMGRLVKSFQKNDGAERLSTLVDHQRNTSTSFRIFCEGILRLHSQEPQNEAMA